MKFIYFKALATLVLVLYLIAGAGSLKLSKQDVNFGVKIIIPGIHKSDLIFSEIPLSNGNKRLSFTYDSHASLKAIGIKEENGSTELSDKKSVKQKSVKKTEKKKLYDLHTSLWENQARRRGSRVKIEPDPKPTLIAPSYFKAPGNCFYIQNIADGLYLTFTGETNARASLRPFYKTEEQALCTALRNGNDPSSIVLCFKARPDLCLDGSMTEPIVGTSDRFKSYILRFIDKSTLQVYYSTFDFEPDYTSKAVEVFPSTFFINLKIPFHAAPLTVVDGYVKSIYNPSIVYDSVTGDPKDPAMKWAVYLESCNSCLV